MRALKLAPLVLAVSLLVAPAYADVTLNLKDAEISTLIATVSEVTGKNFIVDPRVKGKVTVVSARPMDKEAVYQTFLAVLQVQGFAAIPAGRAIKIVPEANVRTDGGTYTGGGEGRAIDDVVTHVYTPVNISSSQLVPMLRPLVSQWGHLAAYPGNNTLIIADRAGNVARLEELIRRMDQGGDKDVDTVELKNASAAEVVRILTSMAQAAKQADPSAVTATIIADERSNAVLLGGEKGERARMISLIRKLDAPLKESDGNTQVVYLRYASAENLAPILEGYAAAIKTSGVAPGAAASPTTPSSGSTAEGIKVIADKDTNALVITANAKQMRQLKSVIEQLDIQRAQVLVEAVIAEISDNKTNQLGLDFAVYNPNGGAIASILSSSTLSALSSIAGPAGPIGALSSAITQGVTAGGVSIQNDGRSGTSIGVILRALKSDGDTNVLSTPSLVSLDNEESEVKVGQEVPFQTGSYSNSNNSNNSVNPFQTIERKDVGLTLAVTPQIHEGNNIKLKIKLESSSVAAGIAGTANLVTNKRTITNTVNVESGQVLVIGGLKDDNLTDTVSGVPLLSDIPLLGALFRNRSVTKMKRNLVVFIHPVILRNRDEGDFYTRRKYDSVRLVQAAQQSGGASWVGGNTAVLPDFDSYVKDSTMPPRPVPVKPAALAPVMAEPAPVSMATPAPAAQPEPTPAAAPISKTQPPNVIVIPAQQPQR